MKRNIVFLMIAFIFLNAMIGNIQVAAEELVKLPRISTLESKGEITAADFSKDDRLIVTGDSLGDLSVWRTEPSQLIANWSVKNDRFSIQKIFFALDDQKIISIANDMDAILSEISLWDVETGKLDYTINTRDFGNFIFVNDTAMNQDETILFVALSNGTILFLDIKTGQELLKFNTGSKPSILAYNASKNELAIGLSNKDVNIYNATTGSYKQAITDIYNGTGMISYTNDGQLLYGNGPLDNRPFILNALQNYQRELVEENDYELPNISWKHFMFSPNDKYIGVGASKWSGSYLTLIDTTTKNVIGIETIRNFSHMTFNHAGNRLLVGDVLFDTSILPTRELDDIEIQQEAHIMAPNEFQEVVLNSVYSDGSKRKVSFEEVKWISSNPKVAKFSFGKLEAIEVGVTTISAEYRNMKTSLEIQVQNYKDEGKKVDVPKDKVWTVNFSKKVNLSTIKEEHIYITDEHFNKIPLLYYVEQGSESTVQLMPVKNYNAGKTYTLWIKDVQSASGNQLEHYSKMDFEIEF